MTMAYQIKNAAYQSDLKSRAVSVLTYLCDRSDNLTLTCFPSLKTIAKCLHIGLSTVKRALAELVEKGFVVKNPRFSERKNGAQTSNLYTLAIPEGKRDEKPVAKIQVAEVVPEEVVLEIPDQVATKIENSAPYQANYITFEDLCFEAEYARNHTTSTEDEAVQSEILEEVSPKEAYITEVIHSVSQSVVEFMEVFPQKLEQFLSGDRLHAFYEGGLDVENRGEEELPFLVDRGAVQFDTALNYSG